MSHSPGPWTWGYGTSAVLEDATGKRLLSVEPGAIFNMAPKDSLLIAAAPRMLDMLRKHEWGGEAGSYECAGAACPECGASKDVWSGSPRPGYGMHYPTCELAALLEELK